MEFTWNFRYTNDVAPPQCLTLRIIQKAYYLDVEKLTWHNFVIIQPLTIMAKRM